MYNTKKLFVFEHTQRPLQPLQRVWECGISEQIHDRYIQKLTATNNSNKNRDNYSFQKSQT